MLRRTRCAVGLHDEQRAWLRTLVGRGVVPARRFVLRGNQQARGAGLLPGWIGDAGGTDLDDRWLAGAERYRHRAGLPWADLPARVAGTRAAHRCFRRAPSAIGHGATPTIAHLTVSHSAHPRHARTHRSTVFASLP